MNIYLLAAYCFTFTVLAAFLVKIVVDYRVPHASKKKK